MPRLFLSPFLEAWPLTGGTCQSAHRRGALIEAHTCPHWQSVRQGWHHTGKKPAPWWQGRWRWHISYSPLDDLQSRVSGGILATRPSTHADGHRRLAASSRALSARTCL